MAPSAKNTSKKATPVPPRGKRGGPRPTTRPTAQSTGTSGGAAGDKRAAQQRQRRRRTWLAATATAVVVVVIAVLVVVGLSSGQAKAAPRTPVPPATAHALQSVPLSTLVAASAKVSGLQPAIPLNAAPLRSGNKPEFLYIGAEYCPVCATQRWPMVVALSHFGTFTNLQQTRSAVRDGNIATLSFYGSSFTSPYLAFIPVETTTNQPQGNYYKTLETPTPAQQQLWSSTLNGNLSFPFLDIGGKYLLNTSQFSPSTLEGHSFNDIASSVGNNNSTIGANIDASAAALVKYICGITGGQPAATCSAVANVNAPVAATASGPNSTAG